MHFFTYNVRKLVFLVCQNSRSLIYDHVLPFLWLIDILKAQQQKQIKNIIYNMCNRFLCMWNEIQLNYSCWLCMFLTNVSILVLNNVSRLVFIFPCIRNFSWCHTIHWMHACISTQLQRYCCKVHPLAQGRYPMVAEGFLRVRSFRCTVIKLFLG